MDEGPDRPVIDLEAAAGKLGGKGAQGEVSFRDPLPEKRRLPANQKPGPVAAHPSCRSTPEARNRGDHFTEG